MSAPSGRGDGGWCGVGVTSSRRCTCRLLRVGGTGVGVAWGLLPVGAVHVGSFGSGGRGLVWRGGYFQSALYMSAPSGRGDGGWCGVGVTSSRRCTCRLLRVGGTGVGVAWGLLPVGAVHVGSFGSGGRGLVWRGGYFQSALYMSAPSGRGDGGWCGVGVTSSRRCTCRLLRVGGTGVGVAWGLLPVGAEHVGSFGSGEHGDGCEACTPVLPVCRHGAQVSEGSRNPVGRPWSGRSECCLPTGRAGSARSRRSLACGLPGDVSCSQGLRWWGDLVPVSAPDTRKIHMRLTLAQTEDLGKDRGVSERDT